MFNFFFRKVSYFFIFFGLCFLIVLQNTLGAAEVIMDDPTRPSNFVDAKNSAGDKTSPQYNDFSLQAIIVSTDHRAAIINEKIVEVGSMINSKKVVSIDEEKVVLSQQNKKDLVLKLSNFDIKEVSK